MTALVFLIEQVSLGLYILIALGILLSWRRLMRARAAYRGTHFELERDLARYERANAATVLILLIEFALVIVGIQQVVAPTIRASSNIQQTIQTIAQDGVFNTPTASRSENTGIDPSGVQLTVEDPANRVLATPTLTPTPVGTIVPNSPAAVGCDTPGATLQIPANGMRVFEPITIIGTADTPNFAYYRFEIKGPQTLDTFAMLAEYTQPVPELGELGQFVPAFYTPGLYQFRVTVFDNTNTLGPSCMVNIHVSEPIPTATPIGQ
jgi:hypothetical protein